MSYIYTKGELLFHLLQSAILSTIQFYLHISSTRVPVYNIAWVSSKRYAAVLTISLT